MLVKMAVFVNSVDVMSGRGGRGRGRSLFTFNVDSLGFGRGEALPTGVQAPSPLYPVRMGLTSTH